MTSLVDEKNVLYMDICVLCDRKDVTWELFDLQMPIALSHSHVYNLYYCQVMCDIYMYALHVM